MPLLVEITSGPKYWLGSYGPLFVCIWVGEIEPAACRAVTGHVQRLCAREGGSNMAVVSVSGPGTPAPNAEARQALAGLLRDTHYCVKRVAVVRESEGFGSAIVASVVSAVQLLGRPNAGHRFFRAIDEALRWATAELQEFSNGWITSREAAAVIGRQMEFLNTRNRDLVPSVETSIGSQRGARPDTTRSQH